MSTDYLPAGDTALQAWASNFITVAAANHVALGLTTTDISTLEGDSGSFDADMTNLEVSKAATHAATETKNISRTGFVTDIREIVRRIQANPSVETDMKRHLGISPHDGTRDHSAPVAPTHLVAIVQDNAQNLVEWKRNGNKSNTIFVVEAQIGASSNWTQVESTNRTRVLHAYATPGVQIIYRVRATRDRMGSPPSNTAVLYGNSSATVLRLAA